MRRVIAESDGPSLLHSISSRMRPSVGLCFSIILAFFLLSSTICPGRGSPIRSRAKAFTALTARNVFFFFDLAICVEV